MIMTFLNSFIKLHGGLKWLFISFYCWTSIISLKHFIQSLHSSNLNFVYGSWLWRQKSFGVIVVNLGMSINYFLDGMDLLSTIFYYVETMFIVLLDTSFFCKSWALNHTLLLNFIKFHKVEFNLKFNETNTIGVIMPILFFNYYYI
jgi:hypothetical protein